MTDTPMHTIVNCETGEVEVRPFTDEEMSQLEIDRESSQQARAEAEAEAARVALLKASARAKLVAGTPLTAEEADTLVI